MAKLLDKTLRLFLDSIGRRDEYEFYLERFQVHADAAFALIVPDREGFEAAASIFAFDLQFLRKVGLNPVVLLCGEGAAELAGLLQTDEHPFCMRPVSLPEVMREGHISQHLAVADAVDRVLVLVDGSVNREAGLAALVPSLTKRVHFIRARGPLHREDGTPLFYFQTQYPEALHPEDQELGNLASRLAERVETVHISVASPLNLLEELFTVKGAGCLVRRGVRMEVHTDLELIDRGRMVRLLEESFGKKLVHSAFLERASCIYLDADYRGTAILEPAGPYMYISKFAVHPDARGEGLAQELWRAITATYGALFWRSTAKNPINHWYERQADGLHRESGWNVYWRGIDRDRIPSVIADAAGRPTDLA